MTRPSIVIDVRKADSALARLVSDLEAGKVQEVVLARKGRPVARLVPLRASPVTDRHRRIGVARGRFTVPALPAHSDEEVARLFEANATGG